MRQTWLAAVRSLMGAVMVGGLLGPMLMPAAPAQAICGGFGGRIVDVSGCSDPLWEMNYVPPPGAAPPPPGYGPGVAVCAGVGRRISVGGCI